MDQNQFSLLIQTLKTGIKNSFASNKLKTINGTSGAFTPNQIYLLMGQFTGGADRKQLLKDLDQHQRILPMTVRDAEPLVKMGIYSGQKRENLQIIAKYLIDGNDPASRAMLMKTFNLADKRWVDNLLDKAAGIAVPQQSYPPAGMAPPGQGPITYPQGQTTYQYQQGHQPNQDPISYIANNAGRSVFGGLMTADVPTSQRTAPVLYQGPPAGAYPHPVNYPPAGANPNPVNYPPTGQPYPAPYNAAQPDPYQPPQYPHNPAQPGPPQPPQYQHIYPPLSTGDNYLPPAQYPGGAPMCSQPPGYPPSGPPAYQPVAGPPHTASYPPAGSIASAPPM